MKVSTEQPFELIYSLYEHQYLGYLFESFVVQKDDRGRLTFQHQNISSDNAREFSSQMDDNDFELIRLMDSMQQKAIVKKFSKKKMKPEEFFLKVFDETQGDSGVQQLIATYLEGRRAKVLSLLKGKMIFEMGKDGEPTWKQLYWQEEKATALFHFRRNEENTHYFPTLKHQGEKLDWQYNGSFLVCNEPAWLVVNDKLLHFEKEVDGKKLKPFLTKKFIVIPRKVEASYYQKFVTPLVASFDVYAKGFDIRSEYPSCQPVLQFSEIHSEQASLIEASKAPDKTVVNILFKLYFQYGDHLFFYEKEPQATVSLEEKDGSYVFHKVNRKARKELAAWQLLKTLGLEFKNGRKMLSRALAFDWLNQVREELIAEGFTVQQAEDGEKTYFLGENTFEIEVHEAIDWFDIKALVKFGDYEISFQELSQIIRKNEREVKLPNGMVAIIPEAWVKDYGELFDFAEKDEDGIQFKLPKHHLAFVQDLSEGQLAKVTMDRKLSALRDFEGMDSYPMPTGFDGELRPYQKAGYDWMRFLADYSFGGCLADDMGLGKTVQTLALLQHQKEKNPDQPSLLIMPTSLIYNWQIEALKFAPELKVLVYTGIQRDKDPSQFAQYNLVITSYGITRIDIDILADFYFNYIVLDESQAIKNQGSQIAKSVRQLKSRHRLILTGTPLENSTMDLWSQMHFINPGLLGDAKYFKDQFQIPIEKKGDLDKTKRLNAIVKPFVLRRQKSQVAKDLPEKFENIKYSQMSEAQEAYYEEVKSGFRNEIMGAMGKKGAKKSNLLLLQGLSKLRQIANHPKMVDPDYTGDSGKMEDIHYMLEEAISEGHKVLIFSQFVKHLSLVRNHLDEQNIPFAYLDGSTQNRQAEVERFQNTPDLKVFLISLKAGGLGLNLTEADYVFLLDPWWNPAVEAQAVDRAHRIGQSRSVFTYKFITRNSVEEKILKLQKNKLKLATDLIHIEESFVKQLSNSDISELLA